MWYSILVHYPLLYRLVEAFSKSVTEEDRIRYLLRETKRQFLPSIRIKRPYIRAKYRGAVH